MTVYAIANEAITIPVDFILGGEFVTPDDYTYSYKLIDNKQTVLQSEENVIIPEEGLKDRALIKVEASSNNKLPEKVFEDRYIIITFTSGGNPVRIKSPYRIVDEYFYTASVQDVRNVFGINESELGDDEVDLVETYLEAQISLGEPFMEAILDSGKPNFRANRILVLRQALKVFPSLRLRIAESESSGTNSFLRNLKNIDWDELKSNLENELAALEEDLTGESEEVIDNYDPFYVGPQSPDVITGEEAS